MKPVIFVSHISDESPVAVWLKNSISKLLLGGVRFFVSSDRTAIVGGDRWLNRIEESLREAPVVLVLCSPLSVLRPWVNFEAGGAWVAGKRVVPLCHAGMVPSSLPEPLKSLQAYNLLHAPDFQDLVALLAQEAGLNVPDFDPTAMLADLPAIARKTTQQSVALPNPGGDPQVANSVVASPADIAVAFDKLQMSPKLHRYALSLSVTLRETPDQDFFRLSLLWPQAVRIVNLVGLEKGEEEDIDGMRYQELSLFVEKRLWPGQTMKVIGGKAAARIEYEFDDAIHLKVYGHIKPIAYNLYYILYLQDWQPVKGEVSFKELNFY